MVSRSTRWIRLLLFCSRWLGVAPSNTQQRYLHLIWTLLILSSVWVCTTLRLITIKFQAQVLTIEKVLYLVEYPANMLLVAFFSFRFSLSESFIRRQMLQLLAQLSSTAIYKLGQEVGQMLLIILIFHACCIVVDIGWLKFDWRVTLPSNCAHNLPALMISLSLLQLILALRLLCLLQQQHSERLQQQQQLHLCGAGNLELHLEQLRRNCVFLAELHMELLQKFGLALLLNFVNSLLAFCYELFTAFKMVDEGQWEQWLLFIYRILWLLMHAARIWYVLSANERVLEQKCQLCLLLHKLEVTDSRLERSINRFLLELHAQVDCPPTVCGVVELDTLALGGFISALMAIVIFLIQIDLGNKSLMGFSF